jgi:predicted aminopeptidase
VRPAAAATAAFLALLPMWGCSCSTARYLTQATRGQLALVNRARPIPEVLKDERVPTRTRALLSQVAAIKAFGERQGLKPTPNYQDYVALERPAAVWVVSACENLNFKSKEWSFPIVGRFPYLGWFDAKAASEFGDELRVEGWDVDVRGARAYSTLGWFRDSVLSTMIEEGDEALGELVNVVLHESVHATAYVSGQAYFNESLASFVADRLTPRYLPERERLAWEKSEREGAERRRELHAAYVELKALYESKRPDAEKLARKTEVLAGLKRKLGFKRDIGNATLIQFQTYNTDESKFLALWKACGEDGARFMRAIGRVGEKSFSESQQENLDEVLAPLARAGC